MAQVSSGASPIYVDTSAWVKIYMLDENAEPVATLMREASACHTHLIAWAEMRAALARADRMGRFTASGKRAALAAAERDWSDFLIMDATEQIIRRAGDLADRFGLRGYDSVHLAAAEAISLLLMPERLTFVCFDDRLNDAAKALGLVVGAALSG